MIIRMFNFDLRLAAFYLISVVVGGFSAILAYAITFLNGRYGIAGWAWIFVSFNRHP